MADQGFYDAEPPQRRRHRPHPRLYVIARQSPVPWLRVRRLGGADRAPLTAHFGRLAAAERRLRGRAGLDEPGIAALCARLDFSRLVAFGAIARNAIIAAACGVSGLHGPEVAATEDPDYRGCELGPMLVSQVQGAMPGAIDHTPPPSDAECDLMHLAWTLGGRIVPEAALAQSA